MLKKIIVISSVMLTAPSSIAFADVTPYVGANIGYNDNTFQVKDAVNNRIYFNANGFDGGMFAGYGADINQSIYLGGEAFVNDTSINSPAKNINQNGEAQLNTTYSVGLSFLPGYKVTKNTTAYMRAGAVATRFKLTENSTQASGDIVQLLNGCAAQTVAGSQLGVGMQTTVTHKVDFRGEVVHTDYHPFTTFRGTSFSNSVKPRNNQLNVGFVYKFD